MVGLDSILTLSLVPDSLAEQRLPPDAPAPKPFFVVDSEVARRVRVEQLESKQEGETQEPSLLNVGRNGTYFSDTYLDRLRLRMRSRRDTPQNWGCARLRAA